MFDLVCGLLLNLSRSGHRSEPTAKHWYPVPRVVSLLQGDRVNRWLGLLLSEPIPSAREMEDPGKKKATTKKSNVVRDLSEISSGEEGWEF